MGKNERSRVAMSDDEIEDYLQRSRTATIATVGADGTPHLVAMWYAVVDGAIWFETKSKSQKAVNLRRDPRVTVLIEDGETYDSLRGVSFEGTAEITDDPDRLWEVGVSVWERYNGPYTEDMKPFVEIMLQNRIAVKVDVERVRSWDHHKLGMDAMPIGGTTAEHIHERG
ncbi:MAG: PPOX class F420-dependent oxidoreductase [Actinomycetia bacterium]|nr:PPOX class F420-dependent oxidoreductase [Actinomycetes bacterium]